MSEPTRQKSVPGTGRLVLQDGSEFRGEVFGSTRASAGEVVFQTGMVGYPESLTDPSYRGQILVTTYPLIGNYGVPARGSDDPLRPGFESQRIQVSGLIVARHSHDFSHRNAASSLSSWLTEEGVVALSGVDTRALTQRLREAGTMAGKILVDEEGDESSVDENSPFEDINRRNLVAEVSVKEPILYGSGSRRVVLVDCGVKLSIIRSLLDRGLSVLRVPWDHELKDEDGDAIFVSNGPGDPKMATATIENLRHELRGSRPIFGVCLGNQLLALAAGCNTYKLKFGHRSQNQPAKEADSPRCYVTSQNHGFAVDGKSLPEDWEEWLVNANDGSNEGIRHRERPFWAVQFHPEANPGPLDTSFLFDRFAQELR